MNTINECSSVPFPDLQFFSLENKTHNFQYFEQLRGLFALFKIKSARTCTESKQLFVISDQTESSTVLGISHFVLRTKKSFFCAVFLVSLKTSCFMADTYLNDNVAVSVSNSENKTKRNNRTVKKPLQLGTNGAFIASANIERILRHDQFCENEKTGIVTLPFLRRSLYIDLYSTRYRERMKNNSQAFLEEQ